MQIHWECSPVLVDRRTRVPWKGTAGLASDIRYYGAWMREEAYKRIGHLYPKVHSCPTALCNCSCMALGAHGTMYQSRLWSPHASDNYFPVI